MPINISLSGIESGALMKLIAKEVKERRHFLPYEFHKALVTADNKIVKSVNKAHRKGYNPQHHQGVSVEKG